MISQNENKKKNNTEKQAVVGNPHFRRRTSKGNYGLNMKINNLGVLAFLNSFLID